MLVNQSCNMKNNVDMIIHNGVVYTVDDKFTVTSAVAVENGVVVAVGDDTSILNNFKSENIIDLMGKPMYPGFIDGHCHFKSMGENFLRYADLKGCLSFEEVVERLKKHAEIIDSEWILGRGWDQNLWENKAFPTNDVLNELFPDNKVAITRVDGHAGLVNDNVLKLMNFDNKSVVDGGELLKNNDGSLSGILLDKAYDLVKEAIPELSEKEMVKALLLAQDKCFELGLTSVTDAGLSLGEIMMIDSLQKHGLLKINTNVMMNPDDETLDYFVKNGVLETEKLTVRSVKLYADGALGSRGAKLLEPYSDDADNTGLFVENDDYYQRICEIAYNNGFQVCTHAIGDAAVRKMLNIYGRFLKEHNDLRWRIEHAQILHPDDFKLFGKYSIIPSIQSTHATSDMFWAVDRLGVGRLKTSYAQKQLLAENGWIVNGTDFPIEHISPIYTFYAAVARKNIDRQPVQGFNIENALSRKEAMQSITIWAAKGCFEENRKGSIEVGKKADFVVLDNDIMTIEEADIIQSKVIKLFVDGAVLYEN